MIREPSISRTVQAQPVGSHGVPDLRRAPELAEDEPGHRVEVLLPELRFELLVEVVDRVGAVDADAVLVDPLDGGIREVELVLDVADDLFEQVFESDDSLHVAVLVDHDRHVLLLATEVGEERREILRLRHDERRTHDGLELDGREAEVVHRAEEIAHVEDADDVVERAAIDGVAGEGRVDDCTKSLVGWDVDGDPDDLGTRNHHRGDLLRGEVEDLVEHLLLGLLELADVLGRRDRVADVLARVRDHPGRGRLDAQQPQEDVR